MKTDLATAASGRRSGRRGASEAGPWRPEEGLCYRLKHAYHAWTRHFDAALRPLGLTHVQFLALYAIERHRQRDEIPSQSQVAAATQLDPMMISKILRLLEERGYLKRSPHPDDPRANALHLTHAGDALVRAAMPVVRDAHATFFDCRLDADSQQALAQLLDRVLAPPPRRTDPIRPG
jgi:DNA-binding MarR family transcriptional regulator